MYFSHWLLLKERQFPTGDRQKKVIFCCRNRESPTWIGSIGTYAVFSGSVLLPHPIMGYLLSLLSCQIPLQVLWLIEGRLAHQEQYMAKVCLRAHAPWSPAETTRLPVSALGASWSRLGIGGYGLMLTHHLASLPPLFLIFLPDVPLFPLISFPSSLYKCLLSSPDKQNRLNWLGKRIWHNLGQPFFGISCGLNFTRPLEPLTPPNRFILFISVLFTPKKLASFSTDSSPACWSCSCPHADLKHMLFDCPPISHFWQLVWS